MPTYETQVVGMHFRERDGVPAKAIVANMIPPVELTLEREPDNRFDAYAIKVLYEGQHIGYIPATDACYIAPDLDDGATATCTVEDFVERKNNLHPICSVITTFSD